MFKLIFRLISLVVFSVILIVAIAVWKGGKPFRSLGEGTIAIGQVIKKFADTVDEMKKGGEKVGEQLKDLKEDYDALKDKKVPMKPDKNNETSHKDQGTE
jgi:cell shape-determining protein MreC